MNRSLIRPFAAVFVLLLAAVHGVTLSFAADALDSDRELSVEWIFSEEGKRFDARTSIAWTDDGDLLLYDATRPHPERTIERITPKTAERVDAVDAAKALASLAGLRGMEETESETGSEEVAEGLEWPSQVAPDGKHGQTEQQATPMRPGGKRRATCGELRRGYAGRAKLGGFPTGAPVPPPGQPRLPRTMPPGWSNTS